MLIPLIITVSLFLVGFGIKKIFRNLCVLCFAITGTWITLIGADVLSLTVTNKVVFGIYMGGSAVGLMYYLATKLPPALSIFKLPLLTSLFFAIYTFLIGFDRDPLLLLVVLWLLFLMVFFYRANSKIQNIAKGLLDCCKNW
jgi:hypothetical protein